MIKLLDLDRPPELTDEVIDEKTSRFINDKDSVVWKDPYIVNRLMQMSRNKCCYCERRIGINSEYPNVDHYHPKSRYEKEVVKWDNLLPSCPRCNNKKHTHDTEKEPIVHPKHNDPRKYLCIYYGRYYAINNVNQADYKYAEVGDTTCAVLHLNDLDILEPRFNAANTALDTFQTIFDNANGLYGRKDRNNTALAKLRNSFINLLKEAQPESEYSATVATSILGHHDYRKLIGMMEQLGIWNEDMQALHNAADSIRMPPTRI